MAIERDTDDAVTPAPAAGPPTDLDAWRAEAGACAPLDAAATRGPWLTIEEAPRWDTPNAVGYDSREHHRGPPYYATGVRCGSIEQAESDGRFIAAARTGWPRDAARVGVLCERVAAWRTYALAVNVLRLSEGCVEEEEYARLHEEHDRAWQVVLAVEPEAARR